MKESLHPIISIVHVVKDDKFFSRSAFYDQLKNVENSYFLYSRRCPYCFKHIKKTEKVTLFYNYIKYIKAIRKADIVFFNGLLTLDYITLCFTTSKQKVIWWSWGFDLYNKLKGLPPLINLELYKPLTKAYLDRHQSAGLLAKLKNKVTGSVLQIMRRRGLSKVDYMIPSMPLDYEMIKSNCSYFRAQPFPLGTNKRNIEFVFKQQCGNVLIGNSLTYSNNHLDVFDKLKDIILPDGNKYIIPISYGTAYKGGADLKQMTAFMGEQAIWLESFMERMEYFKLLESVSHAIFGVIRQQALSNINYCLQKGVKVFLYNDSLVAQQLRRDGYIIYSIEEDLTSDSLSIPLSKEQAYHNYSIFINRYTGRTIDDVQKAIESAVVSKKV